MYTQFYGFSKKPFNVTPDPKFLYLTPDHREALASMVYGINERKGFISITGEVGTGKTTLIYAMLEHLNDKVKTVFIFHTNITFEELLKNILLEIELPVVEKEKTALLRQLNEYLIQRLSRGENLAIIIDEAQNLTKEVLEEIRLLSNLETPKAKLLQIVLVGQPELEAKLESPDLRQIKQRIGLRRQIRPLNKEECRKYIDHRLHLVGSSSSKIFTSEALSLICAYGQGIPRTINLICDNALLIGYSLSRMTIDADIIHEVMRDMDGSTLEKSVHLEPTVVRQFQSSRLKSNFLSEPRDLKIPNEKNISFPASYINEFGHYLKNTLGQIRNLTHLSADRFDDIEFGRHFCAIVTEDIGAIDSVADLLLGYVQISTPVHKADTVRILLGEILEECRKPLEDKKIRILKKFEKDLPETRVHDEQLRYILNSILRYVVLSTPSNGSIILFTKSLDIQEGREDERILSLRDRKYIEILIHFTEHKNLKEEFEAKSENRATPKEEGMNLMLLLTKELIWRNGGTVKFKFDGEKSQALISLRFPAERRQAVYDRPVRV